MIKIIIVSRAGVCSNNYEIMNFYLRWSTHWFKVIIDVPEEWTGQRVHFRWNSGSEAMVIRYYHAWMDSVWKVLC